MRPDEHLIEMPMFPLGSVLFPDGLLPLHIFETRYQQLLNHALETDRRFGVVLISRGSEVGGGESRTDIGTIAVIDEHQRFDDGRAAVMCHGTNRCEVVEWLDDAPYPRAKIRELAPDDIGPTDHDLFDAARQSFDEFIQTAHRLGRLDAIPDVDWAADIEPASWQLASRSPCSTLDQYTVLAAPTRADRLVRIKGLLSDVRADLELLGRA